MSTLFSAVNLEAETPAYLAAYFNRVAAMRTLVELGADVSMMHTLQYHTFTKQVAATQRPAQVAAARGYADILAVLPYESLINAELENTKLTLGHTANINQ